ncbi:hypothetical protein EYF80_032379 [Liparis tanakae]|uniref:Uncharacterized protein n=1 Tax=Liparis tanakae TaxID=230148 RepID=A0A4Z2GW03_9TELE|nr:hypothetical protein EYF80_032379 [Liparis tanakae]
MRLDADGAGLWLVKSSCPGVAQEAECKALRSAEVVMRKALHEHFPPSQKRLSWCETCRPPPVTAALWLGPHELTRIATLLLSTKAFTSDYHRAQTRAFPPTA